MRNNTGGWIRTAFFLICSAVFTVLVTRIDVQNIGPEGTAVGFATINSKVNMMTGVNMNWYAITDIIGYVALAVCAAFGLAGLIQLIKRKSLFKVDKEIIALGGLYVLVIIAYVAFDKFAINYRPVIMPGEMHPEASYPSSHSMLACVVFGTAPFALARALDDHKFIKWLLAIECILIMAIMVGGRLYSGVHWLTDIAGGVLFSITFISGYCAAIKE